jgi:Ca2+-binding RTX toxin-like protein
MRRTIVLLTTMALTLLVASGVALAVTKIGTDGLDTLRGTNGDDNLLGKGGNDILFALRGQDQLLGGPGKDVVAGGNKARPLGGDKNLLGGPGNDGVFGSNGSDNLVGADGNDWLVDRQRKSDKAVGGSGNDVIDVVADVRPSDKDTVVCGSGFDRVLANRKDVVAADCEKVSVGDAESDAEKFYKSIPESFFEGLHPALRP